ncbi:MAG: hypothetical protein ACI4EF_04255 [Coprococcus sp.]
MEKEKFDLKNKISGLFDAKNSRIKNFIMLLLIGICLMIIVWPEPASDSGDSKVTSENYKDEAGEINETSVSTTDEYISKLEEKLSGLLSSMNGVDKVQVMITLKDHGENVVEKDKNVSSITGADSNQNNSDEKTVTSKSENYDGPYVKQVLEPNIEGVLICCTGGGNPDIVLKITEAVQALFDVPVHKIVVLEAN